MEKDNWINKFSQFAIPILTVGAQIITALKYPQYGLIVNLLAQPFWLYSSWKSYKEAGQIGIFVNTVVFSLVTLGGIINYWFL
ncbi:MAG: hypothetical protein ACD_8C00113G0004 [uncultured bacterium]|nr:MAG: hypothetical protein ACD_8C00113G0004 [uncultured bacterium]